MTKELDTSWFDLTKYNALKTMSIEGWASVLESRAYIDEFYSYALKKNDEDIDFTLQEMADDLKAGLFSVDLMVDAYINVDFASEMLESFSTSTVDSLRSYKVWEIIGDESKPEWSAFQKMRVAWLKPSADDENNDDIREAAKAPYDFRFKRYLDRDYIPSSAIVEINLNAPNEQIINDFNHWLTHYRNASGINIQVEKIHQKIFSQKTFDHWVKYSLVPYIDLRLIEKIEGKEINQAKIADLIFPNPVGFTAIERLRDSTISKAKKLMEEATRSSLLRQAASEKLGGMKNTKNRPRTKKAKSHLST